MTTDGNKPAYPYEELNGDRTTYQDHFGMTLREHYAGLAMQGAITNPAYEHWTVEQVAELAVRQADALIAALNK